MTLYICSKEEAAENAATIGASEARDPKHDKLNMEKLNALPGPLMARFCGDTYPWPVYDIDVQTGMMRIDVCGLLDVKHFGDVMELQDGNGDNHDPDQYWID